ncbi:MAG: macrolide transporter ATP-binding/permease protein [Acidobacteria bacterium]|nr:macrolide transporter ATP-binding/permease protein [Acidobacteriota bacterium]
MVRDLRSALRSLLATPWSTAAAVVTIALGAGANTAMLAVAYGVLVRPLPYPDPGRLVVMSMTDTVRGTESSIASADEVAEWPRRLRTVSAVAGYSGGEFTMRGLGQPRLVRAALVTPQFFDVLGLAPVAGRPPSARQEGWAVLGEALAREAAPGGAPATGRGITVGDIGYEITAVAPPDFGFPADDVRMWIPASAGAVAVPLGGQRSTSRSFRLVARLAPGVTLDQARDDVMRVFREVKATRAEGATAVVTPLQEALVGKARPVLNALMAGAILVLLVACGNVATLLVGRSVARSRDTAVRLALGAGPRVLIRGALAESLLLALAGSAAGIAVAAASLRVFSSVAAEVMPRLSAVRLDAPVLAGALLAAVVVTVACGVAPAWHAVRTGFAPAFRTGTASASRGARRLRGALVAAQIALSIVLLVGAALIGRTVVNLLGDAGGVRADHAVAVRLMLDDRPRFDAVEKVPMVRELLRRVRALPGVTAAAVGSNLPPRNSQILFTMRVVTEGSDKTYSVYMVSATPGFFEALGTPAVRGRLFDASDETRDQPVAVLSESALRAISPSQDLLGRDLPFSPPALGPQKAKPRVVGVVKDVKYSGLDAPSFGAIYMRWSDLPASVSYLVVRTASDPKALITPLRRVLTDLDPNLPVTAIRTLEDEFAASIADRRIRVVPAVGFAALALLVSLVGLGGVLVRGVVERRRELAIRAALGQSPGGALRSVAWSGALLALAGVAAGLGLAAGAARWLRSLLFGIGPFDAATFAGVAVVVAAAAMLTSFLAARRALRVEPLELLRSE